MARNIHATKAWEGVSVRVHQTDDYFMAIRPEDYHALKDKIGEMVLERMRG